MDVSALLKTFIYLISSSLLYPALFLLVLLTLWTVIYAGSFFAEWLERLKLTEFSAANLSGLSKEENNRKMVSHRVVSYVKRLKPLLNGSQTEEIEIENLLQENNLKMWKALDHIRMIIRVGPSLGLIGTLIPMGTGLAAMGQGDMVKLSSDLVIAFTTTVVGLAVGITAYFFYTVKRRWVEEDIKNMELVTELLANNISIREEFVPEEKKQ
jgi:biopolymer transport protein ExbB/TolQ